MAYLESPNARLSNEGGFLVKVKNNTGESSVKGKLVQTDTTTGQVILTTNDVEDCFGAIYEAGIANGSDMWIVVGGIAEVLLEDNVGVNSGDWIGTGDAAYAQVNAGSPPVAPTHFLEIGHAFETVAAGGGGTHQLAKILMHIN